MLVNSSISTSIYLEMSRAIISEENIDAKIVSSETKLDDAIISKAMSMQALATLQEQYFSGNISTLDALPALADQAIVGAVGGK
jgi:hypothetical protein